MEQQTARLKTTPKDFFLYLLGSITLYYCAVWLITLFWQYINHFYPKTGQVYGDAAWIPQTMRWAIASLAIVFPVYLLVTQYLNKDLSAQPEKRELRIRKWLTYLTLFIATATIIVDLVTLVFNLLEGDFTIRFILKVFSVLFVAALVFGYYFYEIRRDSGLPAPTRKLFYWVSIALVAGAVIGAFFVVGSPANARKRQNDLNRVNDFQSIQWQIVNYWQQKQKLPEKLSDLNDPISGFFVPVDPETKTPYEYRATDPLVFELCASFNFPSDDISLSQERYAAPAMPAPAYDGLKGQSNWSHDAGHACFTREIDPERYPPIKR